MEQFLIEREPLFGLLLMFVPFVEPGEEDGDVLAPLEDVFPHQADDRIDFIQGGRVETHRSFCYKFT